MSLFDERATTFSTRISPKDLFLEQELYSCASADFSRFSFFLDGNSAASCAASLADRLSRDDA
jgi:hypothetical protein